MKGQLIKTEEGWAIKVKDDIIGLRFESSRTEESISKIENQYLELPDDLYQCDDGAEKIIRVLGWGN